MGLSTRVYTILILLVLAAVSGGLFTIWYAGKTETIVRQMMQEDVIALQAARNLESALVSQKGYLTYFYTDGDRGWLEKLDEHIHDFEVAFASALDLTHTDNEKRILEKIQTEYNEYSEKRDRVIELYKAGKRQEGAELHWQIRLNFFAIHDLAEEYKKLYTQNILIAQRDLMRRSRHATFIVTTGISAVTVLGIILAIMLATQVIKPIQRISEAAAGGGDGNRRTGNEVTELSRGVKNLIEDVGTTRKELEQSREMLAHAEKMAVLGKLSSEVAHSIRNPMTSIKMRLFSLQRGLEMTEKQKEDISVLSEEMRRLDNIVRNFLEFSRPPKLKKEPVDLSELMTMTLGLLEHRLRLSSVSVERKIQPGLSKIMGDPELLKEVLVNLVVNACDAMEDSGGGMLIITEEEALAECLGRTVMVKIQDTGPGVPEEIRDRVLEPFFTSKEEGTGLGLSIADRIIQEHGGMLQVFPGEPSGAVFCINIPIYDQESES